MLILITSSLLLLTALLLLILRFVQPAFRFLWLTASGGALLSWVSAWVWLARLPLEFQLSRWQPANLFAESPAFMADGLSWTFAITLTTLALAVVLTAVAHQDLTNPLPWAGTLALTALGLLAVTANNPLTLVLVWAAIDLAELVSQLRSVDNPSASERVVIAFSTRVLGIGLVLWANVLSVASGSRLDFHSVPPQADLFLLVAAGLRMGVLPLHLPYAPDSALRRGFGTALRLISAASSLVLLARIPSGSITSPITPVLLILAVGASLYGGWMWLRAPDELAGRPFWMIGMASLAVVAALRGDPTGAAAWSCALVLVGGALFLTSVQHVWLNRVLLVGVWGLSALPFSLTASGWQSNAPVFWPAWPFLLAGQALLIAGFVRHTLRPGSRESIESQAAWTHNIHPAGVGILLLTAILLGFLGWDGALQIGAWPAALTASLLTFGLVWATPRLRVLNPIRAHWVRPAASSWLDNIYRTLWNFYGLLGRLSQFISAALEGDGSIMWTLLFLALFVSFMMQGTP